jgi:uncharacterized protein YihD (DUF1040 family)
VRDPKRIDEILNCLRRMWTASPDIRLGQMLRNVTFEEVTFGSSVSRIYDPFGEAFNYEDDVLLRRLREFEQRYYEPQPPANAKVRKP